MQSVGKRIPKTQLIIDPGHGSNPDPQKVNYKSLVQAAQLESDPPVDTGCFEMIYGRPMMFMSAAGYGGSLYREDVGVALIAKQVRRAFGLFEVKPTHIEATRSDDHEGPVIHCIRKGALNCIPTRMTKVLNIDLATRVNYANLRYKAGYRSAFVSIHSNASSSSQANGFEVIHSSSSSSKNLARCIDRRFWTETDLKPRTMKEGNFYVLKKTKMPAVIIECGFHTNARDLIKLRNVEKLGKTIAKGILDYFDSDWVKDANFMEIDR